MEPLTMMALWAAAQGISSGISAHGQKKAAEKYAKASGSKEQQKFINKLTKHFPSHKLGFEHKGLYKEGYGYLKDLLSNDPKAIEAFNAPYMRQFQEQVIPSITNRFTQFGPGAQRSGGFQRALAQATTGLQENLAQMRAGMQMQALPQALNYVQAPAQSYYNKAALALGRQGLNYSAIPQPGFWGGFGGGLGQGAGNIATLYALKQLSQPSVQMPTSMTWNG